MMNELTMLMIFIHVGVTFGPLDETIFNRAFDGSLRNSNYGGEHLD